MSWDDSDSFSYKAMLLAQWQKLFLCFSAGMVTFYHAPVLGESLPLLAMLSSVGIASAIVSIGCVKKMESNSTLLKWLPWLDITLVNLAYVCVSGDFLSTYMLWPLSTWTLYYVVMRHNTGLLLGLFSITQITILAIWQPLVPAIEFSYALEGVNLAFFFIALLLQVHLLGRYVKSEQKIERQKRNLAHLAEFGEMASEVSHELNTPLAIIAGSNSLVKKLIQDNKLNYNFLFEQLNKIENAVNRAIKIVSGLKNLSRMGDSDAFEYVPLSSIIDDSLTLLAHKCAVQGIELHIAPYQRDLEIYCKRVQISQVLVILINNSIAAMEGQGQKWIRLEVESRVDSVCLSLTDAGPGISSELGEKIFEPFFTTKEVGAGTGLGLSIARKIVKAHEGSFGIDHQCKHTKFFLTLPIAYPVKAAKSA